jgi:MFS family permease
MPIYLADRFDVHAAGRGLMLAVPAVASTTGALTVSRLRHRVGIGRTMSIAFVFLTLGFLLIASAPALPAIVIALLLYGAGEGLSIPTLQDTVASAAPMQSRGALVALFVGFARAGQTVGPVVCGVGLANLGARTTFALAAAVTGLSTVIARPERASVP